MTIVKIGPRMHICPKSILHECFRKFIVIAACRPQELSYDCLKFIWRLFLYEFANFFFIIYDSISLRTRCIELHSFLFQNIPNATIIILINTIGSTYYGTYKGLSILNWRIDYFDHVFSESEDIVILNLFLSIILI